MLSAASISVRRDLFSSEPLKYFLTHVFITVSLVLYYVFVAKYMPTSLLVLTIVFHALGTGFQIVYAFVDPGIVKKNLPAF